MAYAVLANGSFGFFAIASIWEADLLGSKFNKKVNNVKSRVRLIREAFSISNDSENSRASRERSQNERSSARFRPGQVVWLFQDDALPSFDLAVLRLKSLAQVQAEIDKRQHFNNDRLSQIYQLKVQTLVQENEWLSARISFYESISQQKEVLLNLLQSEEINNDKENSGEGTGSNEQRIRGASEICIEGFAEPTGSVRSIHHPDKLGTDELARR